MSDLKQVEDMLKDIKLDTSEEIILVNDSIEKISEIVEKIIKRRLKNYPIIEKILEIDGAVLAGGSLRDFSNGDEPKDFDIFFTKSEAMFNIEEGILSDKDIIDNTAYTTTYKVFDGNDYTTIQLIHKKIYEDKAGIINDFDFSVIQLAFDKNGLVVGEKTFSDLLNQKVSVNIITKPLDSLNRLCKYSKDYDITETYHYILDVMKTQPVGIILGASFYEGDE